MKPWLDDRIAPNGKTVLENFLDWFSGSKVVNASGSPVVAYHATNSRDFHQFRMARSEEGGAWFAEQPDVAFSFGQVTMYPVYLAIKSPLPDGSEGAQILRDAEIRWPGKSTAQMLQLLGYDGLSFNELDPSAPRGARGTTWMVVASTQIKSAIGNSGLYLPNMPSLADQLTDADLDLMRRSVAAREIVGIIAGPKQGRMSK